MALTLEAAQQALGKVDHPDLHRPLTELNLVDNIVVDPAGKVSLTLVLTSPASSLKDRLVAEIEAALTHAGATAVAVATEVRVVGRDITSEDPVPDVKNIVLVMSGKGGVGKSTVAANLTMALHRAGMRVGLLDADIYGPSVPTMFGVMGRPSSADGKLIEPLERFGIKLMSIGFLLEDPKAAVVWRGPMLHGALLQFVKDVRWGKLDYLILDLPPGTGDVALTLSQRVRSTGALIVTTPQEVALQDVYKSVSMCQKVGITVLGVVENESYFICDNCQKRHELFGKGGGQKVAEFADAPLLGQIPIDPSVREWGDAGTPVVQAAPRSPIAKAFVEVAERLADRISVHNMSRLGPLTIDRSGGKGPLHLPITR
jgi:ATP-binding protein involved in chromosome partitioning